MLAWVLLPCYFMFAVISLESQIIATLKRVSLYRLLRNKYYNKKPLKCRGLKTNYMFPS